jgi:hypothetical protein
MKGKANILSRDLIALVQLFFQGGNCAADGIADGVKRQHFLSGIDQENLPFPTFFDSCSYQSGLLKAVGFAELPLEPVAVHGLFELPFAGRHADLYAGIVGRQEQKGNAQGKDIKRPAGSEQLFDPLAAFEPLRASEAELLCHATR